VTAAARSLGEIAIGYRRAARTGDAGSAYGVVLNPNKSDAVTFSDGDRAIVLASD
jgi:hypothetical protein